MKDCIFCQIATREIPKEFVMETDKVMVFPDINPGAPVHLLIIPKKHLREFAVLKREDKKIWDEMIEIVHDLINKYQLDQKGYRIATNGGGAQGIDHFHLHLLGEINKDRRI